MSHHLLVILSEDGDSGLFDDNVCDLVEVTECHPAFAGVVLLGLFALKLVLFGLVLFLQDQGILLPMKEKYIVKRFILDGFQNTFRSITSKFTPTSEKYTVSQANSKSHPHKYHILHIQIHKKTFENLQTSHTNSTQIPHIILNIKKDPVTTHIRGLPPV